MALVIPGKTITALPTAIMASVMKMSNFNVNIQSAVSIADPAGFKIRGTCAQCHEMYNFGYNEIFSIMSSANAVLDNALFREFCLAHRHEGVDPETGESGFTMRESKAIKLAPENKGRVFKHEKEN